MTILTIVILTLIMRIFGALVDGYGLRVPDADSDIWHTLNWARRDVPIFVMYVIASIQYYRGNRFERARDKRHFDIAMAWIDALIANYILHKVFYYLGEQWRLYP